MTDRHQHDRPSAPQVTEQQLAAALRAVSDSIDGSAPDPATVKTAGPSAAGARPGVPRFSSPWKVLLPAIAAAAVVSVAVVSVELSGRDKQHPAGPGPAAKTGPSQSSSSVGHRALPACSHSQLQANYGGGAFATGNDFGNIDVINVSAHDCQLTGSITVQPLNQQAAIRVDRPSNLNATLRNVILTAHGQPIPAGRHAPRSQRWLEIILAASIRTPNGSGPCAAEDQITPTAWKVSGILSLAVPNTDPKIKEGQRGQVPHLYGCNSPRGLSLLKIDPMQAP